MFSKIIAIYETTPKEMYTIICLLWERGMEWVDLYLCTGSSVNGVHQINISLTPFLLRVLSFFPDQKVSKCQIL